MSIDAKHLSAWLDAFYAATPNAIASPFGALAVALTFWSDENTLFLSVWIGAIIIQSILMLALAWARKAHRLRSWADRRWLNAMTACFASGGLIWGIGVFWLLPVGTSDQSLVISLMALGAIVSTFPTVIHPLTYNLFQVPLLTLASAGFMLSSNPFGWLVSLAALMLSAILVVIARGIGKSLNQAIHLSIVNAVQAEELSRQAHALRLANEELCLLSMTDPLTGLGNRRAMMQALRAERGNTGSGFIALDVDHFKRYNDTFGHAAGDECLKVIAGILAETATENGTTAVRQGGEEFGLIVRGAGLVATAAMAEHLRRRIAAASTSGAGLRRPVTVSVGYACDLATQTVDRLLAAADEALYRAKQSGRNQVCGPLDRSAKTPVSALSSAAPRLSQQR